MGILDDAIRQHLDLKRRLGADESELQQLEDEAFGPPARPGDPDFPTGEEPSAPEAALEPATTVVPVEEDEVSSVMSAGPDAGEEDPPSFRPESPGLVESPAPSPPPGGVAEPEPAAEEEPPPESSFTTAEREAIGEQPTVIYDRSEAEALDLGELDLDLDEEFEEVGELEDSPAGVEEPLTGEEEIALEPPSEEAEAVEADAVEVVETEVVEAEEEGFAPEPAPDVLDADEDAGESDEDVLEETPDFLRDNPDDDELWFEQGEPKDFDF